MIHIINKFAGAYGGSELQAIDLYRLLVTKTEARLWATHPPSRDLPKDVPIDQIEPRLGRFPRFGTFIFVGVYFHIGRWICVTMPSRQIVVINTPSPDSFEALRRQILWPGFGKSYEIVYQSAEMKEMFGLPGLVEESLIDLRRFSPGAHRGGTFVVGRLSRDYRYKFHESDPELFTKLSAAGVTLRLMGGTVLRDESPPTENLQLLPEGAEVSEAFLRSLDCFVYRTHTSWFEAYGRIVFEAMACGLPVVCGRTGGYARFIEHGVNGFLFDTNDEAIRLVLALKGDSDLRARIGTNARRTVEKMYSEVYKDELVKFYTGPARFPITNAACHLLGSR
jgi:Glycosyl transferases group 1